MCVRGAVLSTLPPCTMFDELGYTVYTQGIFPSQFIGKSEYLGNINQWLMGYPVYNIPTKMIKPYKTQWEKQQPQKHVFTYQVNCYTLVYTWSDFPSSLTFLEHMLLCWLCLCIVVDSWLC